MQAAGLLTYSVLPFLPVHASEQWLLPEAVRLNLWELTAAGTVRDSHPVPFSFRVMRKPYAGAK